MNHYKTSNGIRLSKIYIDRQIVLAKKQKLEMQLEEYGFNFCSKCNRNDCLPITVSHIESVDSCQKNSISEKSWDLDNLQILGLKCHAEYDKNNVMSSKLK